LLWGYAMLKKIVVGFETCPVSITPVTYSNDTIRALLLVGTTSTPHVRHIELRLIINVAPRNLVPSQELMLD
jgi:hypothetical protein